MRICVYCSSSSAVAPVFAGAARKLGHLIGQRGHDLIYGGSTTGTMGLVAAAAHEAGAHVIGVLPEQMVPYGIANEQADEMIVTATMAERKATMEARAEAFVALPGGFGTLEELSQALTLKQLGYHACPITLINVDGLYDHLLAFFEALYAGQFAKEAYRQLYRVTETPEAALDYIEGYQETALPNKWFL